MYLSEIAKKLDIDFSGEDIEINGINTLKDAKSNQISFFENIKYKKDLQNTNASAVFIKKEHKDLLNKNSIALIVDNPYVFLAKATKFFAKKFKTSGNRAIIGDNSYVKADIGFDTKIGNNCIIYPNVYIGNNVTIGNNCIIYPNVSIYDDTKIGNDCIIHSGSVIGSDGFGFANDNGKYIKIYHNGNVIIEDDVEIGSNTTIDRAAFNSTIIRNGARIDNLVQIAHNCIVGKGSIITAQCGLAGSSILEDYVVMGAQSGVTGHLKIAPFTQIAARSVVSKNITKPNKKWAGFPLLEHNIWLKLQAKISRLLKD